MDEPDAGKDLVRDEDDHDLLTYAETGIRLREEISFTKATLRACGAAAQRATLEARLTALTEALARNTRQAAANPGVKGFLDYEPARVDQETQR